MEVYNTCTNTANEQELIDLFWRLFVHREDVYAHYISTSKESKSGWRPAYDYDNNRKGKPRPLTPLLLRMHFSGGKRLGIYSTLPNEQTCKWIAADFDENSGAFEQCLKLKQELAKYQIPCFIERSNSGKGFHAFVFFEKPILASVARRMMYGAMHEAGISVYGKFEKGNDESRAYDRLFPCQDFVSEKGYGNLIALPFYGTAAKHGNTLFVDDNEEVIPDQWGLLREIYDQYRVKIDIPHIETLASLSRLGEARKPDESSTTDVSDLLSGLSSVDGQFERFQGCEAIRQSISNPNQFGNFAWVGVLSNIAVFGTKGRDLAHEASRNYDMSAIKNDPRAIYTEEETDKVFFDKVDFLQRKNGIPMSCKRLEEEGWECPKLKDDTCKVGMPAKYGAPPSFTIYSKDKEISIDQRLVLKQLEETGGYEEFRKILPWGDKISDYRIARHLIGIFPLSITTYNPNNDSVTSLFQSFLKREDAEKFHSFLVKENQIPFNRSGLDFWLLGRTARFRSNMAKFSRHLLDHAGLASIEVCIEKVGKLVNVLEATAPFYGQIDEFVAFLEEG